jgi:hypothetical protein
MQFARRISVMFVVSTFAFGLAARSALAGDLKDVSKIVPQDAWGFIAAQSLDQIDAQAGKLKESLGLAFTTPITPMALGMLNLSEVVDSGSPICAIMMNADKFGVDADGGGKTENAVVLVLPAKDPKALLERLAAEPVSDGLSKCKLMDEEAYVATKGKFLILGPSKDCVTAVSKSKKSIADGLEDARGAAMSKCDLYVSIAIGSVVGAYKDRVMPIVMMMTAAADPEGKSIKQMVKRFEEISSFDLGLRIDDKGINLMMLAQPKEGSDLALLIGDEKNSDDSFLKMLPKEKYLVAFGGNVVQSEHSEKFGGGSPIADIVKMSGGGEEHDAKAIETLDNAFKKLNKLMSSYAISISSLPEGSEGMFGAAIVARTTDAKEFVESVRKVYEAAWKVSKNEDITKAKEGIVHTPDAESAAGGKVDTIKFDMKSLAELTKAGEDDVKKVEQIFGKDFTIRFGAVDDKNFVLSFGGGKKRHESVCSAVKSSGDPLSSDTGIAELSSQLHKPRGSEAYFAIDNIAQTVKVIMKAMGEEEEFPFDVPTINAPLAASTAVDGKISRVDLIVPMKLIKAIKEAYDKFSAASSEEDFDEGGDSDESDASSEEGDEESAKPKAAGGKSKKKAEEPKDEESDSEDESDEGGEKKSDE